MTDHADDIARWHAARLVALQAADGWLNLTDRIDLSPGFYRVGQAEDCDLRLSVGPARLGVLELTEDGSAKLDTGAGPRPFVPVPDAPPRLRTGDLLLEITDLAGSRALRVRDLASPEPARFAGIERFPVDPAWRIVAQWEVLDTPEARTLDTVVGISTEVRLTHRARFTHEGREVTLIPTHWKAGKPMFVIRDATATSETYAAGRFLIGDVEQGGPEGRVVLDFNKAFNPPCAFTDLAACPLPPPENRLPFAIRAGERRPA